MKSRRFDRFIVLQLSASLVRLPGGPDRQPAFFCSSWGAPRSPGE